MSVSRTSTSPALWATIALCLLLLRLPAFAQPAGGDQSLYVYSGQQLLDGGVPYEASWDQKPPGIFVVYAWLWRVWPHQSVVALGDLLAAAVTAAMLFILGRRAFGATAGGLAACVFLLFGHPALTRLGGAYVRGQCETYIAAAIAAAIALVARPHRSTWTLLLAGVLLGAACWIKYNALAYALPLVVAIWIWPRESRSVQARAMDALWIAAGLTLVTAATLIYFAAHGALTDLKLATIDYNVRYSGETYGGFAHAVRYVLMMPLERARVDMLWFLGAIGVLLAVTRRPFDRVAWLTLAWLAAATASIAVNGARNLPQYFVQAGPALALAAGAGLTTLGAGTAWRRWATVALLVAGFWRVGDEPALVLGLRLGGLPQLVQNLQFDLDAARGRIDRASYLARFSGGKFDAAANDEMIRYVDATTRPTDSILTFGFSGGGICAWSGRRSASRFFWSRPVMIGFADDQPGYGVAGLLGDLQRDPPALVILQKIDWHQGEPDLPNSADFFLSNPQLRAWLDAGYTHDRESAMFDVWRRRG